MENLMHLRYSMRPTSDVGISLLQDIIKGRKNTYLLRFYQDKADLFVRNYFFPVLSYQISLTLPNPEEGKVKEWSFSDQQISNNPVALLLGWHNGRLQFDLVEEGKSELCSGGLVELTGFVEYFDSQKNTERVVAFTRFLGEDGPGLLFQFEKSQALYSHFEEENS